MRALLRSLLVGALFPFTHYGFVNANEAAAHDIGALVTVLRGEDWRLFRWDASEETVSKQPDACEKSIYQHVLSVITKGVFDDANEESLTEVFNALEYVTFCVTDNPANRAAFASYSGIHDAILKLLDTFTPLLKVSLDESLTANIVASASHVIYITVFANPSNHQTFITKGVVQRLSNVIQATALTFFENEEEHIQTPYPWVTMWASVALANVAANYCETENDGRCYYVWTDNELTVDLESLPVVSDGGLARKQILDDEKLTHALAILSCTGPIPDHEPNEEDEEPPVSAASAQIDRDEHSTEITSWAAVSALKNLAIDNKSHDLLEKSIGCFCHHSTSVDWLEEDKGNGLLRHLRRDYPCWFAAQYNSDQEFVGNSLCVDHVFHHENGMTCTDYDVESEPSEDECNITDRKGIFAKDACCACGGGTILTHPAIDGAEDEL